MPQNFLFPQRDQPLLMPVGMRDWLPEDDLVFVVLDAVAARRFDEREFLWSGRPPERHGLGLGGHVLMIPASARTGAEDEARGRPGVAGRCRPPGGAVAGADRGQGAVLGR